MSSYTNYPVPLNFTISGLHETGEVLRCPFVKKGLDQGGLFNYGYWSASAAPTIPNSITAYGNAYVDTEGVHFDGSGDYLQSTASSDYNVATGNFTISLYARIRGGDFSAVFCHPTTQDNGVLKTWRNGANNNHAYFYHTSFTTYPDILTAIPDDTWFHLEFCRSGTTAYLFVDGALVGSMSGFTTSLDFSAPKMGRGGSSGRDEWMLGDISDMLFLKGVALHTSSFIPRARGAMTVPQDLFIYNPHVAVHFPLRNSLEDWSKGVVKYTPSIQHKATLVGSGTLSVNGFSNTGSTGNYISVADSPDYVATTFYMAFSVIFNAGGNHGVVGQSNGGGGNLKWAVYLNAISSGSLSLHMQNPAGAGYNMNFAWVPTPGTKYRIEFSRSGTTLSCWANGTPLGTQSMGVGLPNVGTAVRIGSDGEAWQALNGTVSDFIFLNGTSVAPDSSYDHHMQDLVITKSGSQLDHYASPVNLDPVSGEVKTWIKDTTDGFWSRHGFTTAMGNANVASGYLALDGNGDFLQFADSEDWSLGQLDWTIETWIRPAAVGQANNSVLFEQATDATNYAPFILILKTGTYDYSYNIAYNGSAWQVTNQVFGSGAQNTWSHLALVRYGSAILAFVNGVLGHTYAIGSNTFFNSTNPIIIGGGNYAETYLNGSMQDLRFIKGTAIYTSNFTPPARGSLTPTADTVLLLPLSSNLLDYAYAAGHESAARTDHVYRAYFGTPTATAPYTYDRGDAALNGKLAASAGIVIDDSAVKFSGKDYLHIAGTSTTHPHLNLTGNFTIECWMKDNGSSSLYPHILGSKGSTSWTSGDTALRYNNSGLANKFSYHLNPSDPLMASTDTFATLTWHHVAMVQSGATFKMYVNGGEQASVSAVAGINLMNDDGFTMGGMTWDGVNGWLKGWVCDVRVSTVARYSSTFPPPTRGAAFTVDSDTVMYLPLSSDTYDKVLRTGITESDINQFQWPFRNRRMLYGQQFLKDLQSAKKSVLVDNAYIGTTGVNFDGSGDWLLPLEDADLAMKGGDFTVLGVATNLATSAGRALFSFNPQSSSYSGITVVIDASNRLALWKVNSSNSAWEILGSTYYTSASVTNGVQFSYAVRRSGSTWNVFIDGVSRLTVTASGDVYDDLSQSRLGATAYASTTPPYDAMQGEHRVFMVVAEAMTDDEISLMDNSSKSSFLSVGPLQVSPLLLSPGT